MQTVQAVLEQYGHRFCPENVASGNIDEELWFHAGLTDLPVQAAIRSFQSMFKDQLDAFTMRGTEFGGLKRASVADGVMGPNTELLLSQPRCGCPDYFHPDEVVMQGNVPNECRNDITVSRNFTKLQGLSAATTNDVFHASIDEWSSRLMLTMKYEGTYPNTRIYVSLANLPGSVLADQYLANSDCGSKSKGRMDRRDWNLKLATAVRIHEDGHALGLNHVNDGDATMNSFITQEAMNRMGRLTEGDIREAKRIGYVERDEPTDEWVSGRFTVKINNPGQQNDGDSLGTCEIRRTSSLVAYDGRIWVDGVAALKTEGTPSKFILEPKTEL